MCQAQPTAVLALIIVCQIAQNEPRYYAKDLGNFRIERITHVATRFLTCGDYRQGLARIRCSNPDCHHEYFRPFSCRGFHLCPSCSQKRSLLFAEYLDEQLLFALPHRQFVFTLPKALRVFLRCDPRLFGQISRLIFSLIAQFYSAAAARPLSTAAVLAYQPFGDALRFNPHFHSLILEGGFDSKGQFYFSFPSMTPRAWPSSCVSAPSACSFSWASSQSSSPRPFCAGGKVLYHTSYNPYFKQNTSLWSAPDFIAHLTQFIPP